jgi:hypothetical protein
MMERSRWDTAMRCLEVALHPNTGDDEVVAAVNAFRRIAGGRPLRDLCAAAIDPLPVARPPAGEPQLERLSRENGELRGTLAAAEKARVETAARLAQAQRQLGEIGEELRAARDEAASRERLFAEFRAAQARIAEHLAGEKAELLRALDETRRFAAPTAAAPARPAFGSELAAALRRGDARLAAAEHGLPAGARAAPGPAWIA